MPMPYLKSSFKFKSNLPKANNSDVLIGTKKQELAYKKFHTNLTLFHSEFLLAVRKQPYLQQYLPKQFSQKTFLTFSNQHRFNKEAMQLERSQLIGPKLPVLEAIYDLVKNQASRPNFKNIVFVCGQHLLNTTVSLFEFLIRLGADPKNIFVIGKTYSNNEKVIEQLKKLGIYCQTNVEQRKLGGFIPAYVYDINKMWEKCLEHIEQKASSSENINGIIVLDDGGHVLDCAPPGAHPFIIGIEQTSSGVESAEEIGYPMINLAASAVKKWIEPPLVATRVAQKVIDKLSELKRESPKFFPGDNPVCGIIGLGCIGQEVLEQLLKLGYKHFIIFDQDYAKSKLIEEQIKEKYQVHIVSVKSASKVFGSADIAIGCTGKDVTENNLDGFEVIRTPKILLSCSSKDTEFHTLLTYIQKCRRDRKIYPLKDIEFQNGFGAPLKIVRGGTPVNFDNSEESVSATDIQVIRGLKAAGILQAYAMLQDCQNKGQIPNRSYKLDPQYQAFVASAWLQVQSIQRYPEDVRKKYTDPLAIAKQSGGISYDPEQFTDDKVQEVNNSKRYNRS